ncbi:FMRFamide-activated amiloride-sensitive sodium channel [Fasciola gigantica]|uniref:FMRFamide-activated amiloride-sensitive sodium channel n=1 Tax=Fasciola gigantica TaxID=46835 RepID=A0A504YZK8_FASGI|nr:FMRFamide-activated amiloride-sensitive sodium channel [Fasciola gigantica]
MPKIKHCTESMNDAPNEKNTKQTKCRRARDNAFLFLESVSIRGCNRIVKAQNRFIRHMWIWFLIITSLFLCVSVSRLISEYLNYSVNIQTYVHMDAPANFPAITFCNHQPFSEHAYKLWRLGEVISPTQFNRVLRQAADRQANVTHDTMGGLSPEVAHFAFVFDSVKLYYQNLNWPYQTGLGHQRNESIYMCLFRHLGGRLSIGGSGCHDSMIRVTLRSHPHHFNCHTVSIDPQYGKQVQEVGLIIWLGPQENYDEMHRQAFLLDLFDQAYGLRVAIHEPEQLANLDSHGIQIEPGRMNELNFEVVRNVHMKTPKNPCITKPESKYQDLDSTYDYEFELCLNTLVQTEVVRTCQCLYAYLPRIAVPNKTLPYCGRFLTEAGQQLMQMPKVLQRMRCASDVISQSAHLKKLYETEGLCLRRCESVDYVSTVSVTTWRSTQWQLHWSQETAAALDVMDTAPLFSYFRTNNLSSVLGHYDTQSESPTGKYGFSDRYTYVLVKRKSNDTTVKAENLVLTFNALVSRIGGLCSLYIGMTFAVVIELIEFVYIALCQGRFEHSKPKTGVTPKQPRENIGNNI